jgi:hypothetical protein
MKLKNNHTYVTRNGKMRIQVKKTHDLFEEYFKADMEGLPGLIWSVEGKFLSPFSGYEHLDLIQELRK